MRGVRDAWGNWMLNYLMCLCRPHYLISSSIIDRCSYPSIKYPGLLCEFVLLFFDDDMNSISDKC